MINKLLSRKLFVGVGAASALPFADIPDKWIWPVVVIVAAYLIGQVVADAFRKPEPTNDNA